MVVFTGREISLRVAVSAVSIMEGELLFGVETKGGNYGVAGAEAEVTDPTVVDPTAVVGSLKRRKPQVKLTAELLVGERGLPYVMKNAPKRIRISKRRNAHDNLSHIIQFYQLWAHDLFPKARFNDFIKLCHSLGKSDKLLREYRKNLYREEIDGKDGLREPLNVITEAVRTNVEYLEDDLYSVASRQPETQPEERDLDTQQADTQELHEQDADAQELFIREADNEDMFEEDHDAMEAMRELGF